MSNYYNPNWLPIPSSSIDMAPFWAQFYNVLNIFLPMIFAVVGLSIASLVVTGLIKRAFKEG